MSSLTKGTAAFVVQDSYYKDLHNDLPSIVMEILAQRGLRLSHRVDFTVRNPLRAIHTSGSAHRTAVHATESVLLFS
jgi:hypothetical protein